jgi:lipopolysaccharide export system permease protein
MFKILDYYLLKRFLQNLFVALIAWIVIILVVDIIENMSRFIDQKATFRMVFLYYLYYIPYIISLILPVSMLLSALFTLSFSAQHNEIVAQLSAGISLYRLLAPLFMLSLVISSLAGVFNETVVPIASQRRMDIKRYEISHNPRPNEKTRTNIYIQESSNRTLNARYFNGQTNEARNVSIKTFNDAGLTERLDAERMTWTKDHWLLKSGSVRRFANGSEQLFLFKDSTLSNIRITPEQLAVVQKNPEEMSYNELVGFIAELNELGADPRKWEVERQLKIALPMANFIVVLLGAPLASRKRSGGIGLNFGLSLMVSFIYFIIIRTGQVFGHQGQLQPMLAAWLGNLIFFTLGLYSLLAVRK